MIKATAVLITREKEYPKIILDRLTDFDEIIIETECPCIYRRYELAQKAKNDIIYFQDDDCLVNYQELFTYYNGRITNEMTEHHLKYYEPLGATLIGWGAYFPKSMLNVLDKYIEKYGIDIHLMREADRIFTYLNKPFNSVTIHHEDLPQTKGKMSFEDNHYISAHEAIKKASML